MMDTEQSLETLARLHAEIMRERAEGLRKAAQAAKIRLIEREEALERLRAQVALLQASLVAVPEKQAAMDLARFTTTCLPRTVNWKSFAPHAVIAVCAVFIELSGARLPAPAAANPGVFISPAPELAAQSAPVADDDRSQEALLLVHEWKLPGDAKSLGERLGGEFEPPGGRPSWRVERTGAHDYRVTFQPAEKDLPYAFEADIEARIVRPTPETQELLAPRLTAAFR